MVAAGTEPDRSQAQKLYHSESEKAKISQQILLMKTSAKKSGLALDADQEYQKFETQRQPQRQQQHTSNSSNNSNSTSSKDKGSNRGKNGRPCEICQAT